MWQKVFRRLYHQTFSGLQETETAYGVFAQVFRKTSQKTYPRGQGPMGPSLTYGDCGGLGRSGPQQVLPGHGKSTMATFKGASGGKAVFNHASVESK
jgi:hypothetical protein